MTFRTDIEEAVKDITDIQGVVLGKNDYYTYSDDVDPANDLIGKLLKWDDVKDKLDYEYDSSYGSAECNALYIWTSDRVYLVHEYDGSTCIVWVPRHPDQSRLPEYGGICPDESED